MSTASSSMTVRGIAVDVIYKDIKNLHIGVYPPRGRVRVAAPHALNDDQVRLAVVHRLTWIRRQRQQLEAVDRQSVRRMVTGESHYVGGQRYRLKVLERAARSHLEIDRDRLLLYVSSSTNAGQRRELLDRWYREHLKNALPDLLAKWASRIGVDTPTWTIRRMKTKWGSCSNESGRVRFNLELAKLHPENLEYVVVHELAHLVERSHSDGFVRLMDTLLPNWRARRDRLNNSVLVDLFACDPMPAKARGSKSPAGH